MSSEISRDTPAQVSGYSPILSNFPEHAPPFDRGVALGREQLATGPQRELASHPAFHGASSGLVRAQRAIVRDAAMIEIVRAHAVPVSEFSELNLYHRHGFFERQVTFQQGSMPLCPKIACPWFGSALGVHILRHLSAIPAADVPGADRPQFVGIGAGRGTLDYDLIKFLTGPQAKRFVSPALGEKISSESRFLVTDRTKRAVSYLRENLHALNGRRVLGGRLEIAELDAREIRRDPASFGVVYANEILDNMPHEPIIRIEGIDYLVFYAPRIENAESLPRDLSDAVRSNYPQTSHEVINRADFLRLIDRPQVPLMNFNPLLIPLDSDPLLAAKVRGSPAAQSALSASTTGGLCPYSLGAAPLLEGVRRSFAHGLLVLIDYGLSPTNHEYHNWNTVMNSTSTRNFGTNDFDYTVDFSQLIECGERLGMSCAELCTQTSMLMNAWDLCPANMPATGILRQESVARWRQANPEIEFGRSRMENVADEIIFNHGIIYGMSDGWQVLTLRW